MKIEWEPLPLGETLKVNGNEEADLVVWISGWCEFQTRMRTLTAASAEPIGPWWSNPLGSIPPEAFEQAEDWAWETFGSAHERMERSRRNSK